MFGLGLTALVTWSVHDNYVNTEGRLLNLQTKQAGEVLAGAATTTGAPLLQLAQEAELTHGATTSFVRATSSQVGAHGYADVSLWETTPTGLRNVVTIGARPALSVGSAQARSLAKASRAEGTFAVVSFFGSPRRLGLVEALRGTPYAVYAEDRLPKPGRSTLQSNSAFSDLGFAIYLGRTTTPSHLLIYAGTSVPIRGMTSREAIRFGTSYFTLVATPDGDLAGALAADLPWIFGIAGVVLTLLALLAAEQLVRRRQLAEADASRTRGLNDALARLYQEQRTIAETLQRSLLPVRNPHVPGMEIASRYVAGTTGAEVGGDWYSVLALDDTRFGFVVGDVSGRGFGAATVMAALRYTTRTLLLEGHAPDSVLQRCSHHVREQLRGHFATVLVGVGDVARHELTLSNAGHLPPLVLHADGHSYVELPIGPPVGVDGRDYEAVTVPIPPGTTFLAFTDGLVERRGEHLDVGLARLAAAANDVPEDLDAMLTAVISELTDDHAEDDIAILAIRFD